MPEEPPDSDDDGATDDEMPDEEVGRHPGRPRRRLDTNDELPEVPYEEIIWLSTPKAADRLGITTRTLYRFIDRGDLPAYRFGRVIRLRLSDVDRFIEECLVEPGTLEHLYPEARPGGAEEEADGEGPEADADA